MKCSHNRCRLWHFATKLVHQVQYIYVVRVLLIILFRCGWLGATGLGLDEQEGNNTQSVIGILLSRPLVKLGAARG